MIAPVKPPNGLLPLPGLLFRVFLNQILLGVALFWPAGTLRYRNGWAFVGLMCVHPLQLVIHFYKHDPRVLQRRELRKEPFTAQKIILFALKEIIGITLVVCGFDFRFGWSRQWIGMVPLWLALLAMLIIVACQLIIFRVMQSNPFAASVIRIEEGQKIAAAGPYHFVRHPMYSAGCVLWLFAPLALGSFVAVPLGALVTLVFILRLLHEEKVLRPDLLGYTEYCLQTRYRLIPGIW